MPNGSILRVEKGILKSCKTVYNIENQKNKKPDIKLLEKFMTSNNININDFLDTICKKISPEENIQILNDDSGFSAEKKYSLILTKLKLFKEGDQPVEKSRDLRVSTGIVIHSFWNTPNENLELATFYDLIKLGSKNNLEEIIQDAEGKKLIALGSKLLINSFVYFIEYNPIKREKIILRSYDTTLDHRFDLFLCRTNA